MSGIFYKTCLKVYSWLKLHTNPQRDITPEFAAEKLRNMSDKHYKEASKAKN